MPSSVKDFSILNTFIESFEAAYPIPGQHNLKKVGKKIIEKDDEKKSLKESFSENYKVREKIEKEFNSNPINRIFRFRNLMSGKQAIDDDKNVNISARILFKNAVRDVFGWHEHYAPEGQQVMNFALAALFGAKPLLMAAWKIFTFTLFLPVEIAKLFTMVLPSALYKLSFEGMERALNEYGNVEKKIQEINLKTGTLLKSIETFNIDAILKHLLDRFKLVGWGLAIGVTGALFGAFRIMQFLGAAIFSPWENFRRFWNQKVIDPDTREKTQQSSVLGKILAVVSLVTTVVIYTAIAFFLAPYLMSSLSVLAAESTGVVGTLLNGLVAGINWLTSVTSMITAPLGAALTTGLEFLASLPFLSFLTPAAIAVGNVMPATIGTLTLGGTALALAGTGASMLKSTLSDIYHAPALEESIKELGEPAGRPSGGKPTGSAAEILPKLGTPPKSDSSTPVDSARESDDDSPLLDKNSPRRKENSLTGKSAIDSSPKILDSSSISDMGTTIVETPRL